MRRRLYSIPSVMSPDGSASERNAPPRPRMIWSMSGTERRSAALTLSRVSRQNTSAASMSLCGIDQKKTRSKTESSAKPSVFLRKTMKRNRRAAMVLYQSDSSHSSSLTDDSVFADVIHHCLSLEVEQLHLFYRMAFVPANSSIAGLRTRSHGSGSPRLASDLAATGEWLPTFSHSSYIR